MRNFQVDFFRINLLVCDDCGLQFTPKALISHQNHHHNRESFPCDECEKSFSAPTRLKDHQNHAHSKDNCCKLCDKKFSHYSTLKQHVRTFHEEEKLECKICLDFFSK